MHLVGRGGSTSGERGGGEADLSAHLLHVANLAGSHTYNTGALLARPEKCIHASNHDDDDDDDDDDD